MMVFVLELFGGVCAFSTIAFIGLASVSKLRPDLDEEGGTDLEILLLTEDQLGKRWRVDLDLRNVIDGAALEPPGPKKKKMPRLKRMNLIHGRLQRGVLSP
jgi:hypothetical protein